MPILTDSMKTTSGIAFADILSAAARVDVEALSLINFASGIHTARAKHHLVGGRNAVARTAAQFVKLAGTPMYADGTAELMDSIEATHSKVQTRALLNVKRKDETADAVIKSGRAMLHAYLHLYSECLAAFDYSDPAEQPELSISPLGPAINTPSLEGYGLVRPRVVCELLLDLHARLRISIDFVEERKLQVKLESGVLQGGGTGPSLFRMVYDACIGQWKAETTEHDIIVEYEGGSHSLSVAAYADDLIRIVAGRSLPLLARQTENCTESLQRLLGTRGLKLNGKKGETLLSMKGQGAYESARRAFSGDWSGYPLKLVVKYLGAHIQSNGSMSAEVRKRISAAKAGFARFSRFFRRSHVPLSRKFLVFKAVVDSALLSALEVRPLGASDLQALESARGLLLRRLFGKDGYGAGTGYPAHRSVTVESLRERVGLATVASELRVHRLLWLLIAEQQGQTRLELAALFGVCQEVRAAVDPVSGRPTQFAPRFLHLLHSDLVLLQPEFVFSADWKADFLNVAVHQIKMLRSSKQDLPPSSPVEPADEAPPDVLAAFMCEQCGAGPWQNARALRTHRVKKHFYRNTVQSRCCPHCNRQFTTKTAAQRHVKQQSCGKAVANHGHAGALAGLRIAETSTAAAQAQRRSAPSPVQTSLLDFFNNARDGLSSGSREPCRLPANLRELEAWSTRTWLPDPQTDLAKQLVAQMETWKAKLQQGQAHPLGPSRWTVGATLAKWVLDGQDRKARCPQFTLLHDKMESLEEMKGSVQLAFAKPIKDGRILLKVRPQLEARAQWSEAFALLDTEEAYESKDLAPPGAIIRELKSKGHN